MLIGATYSHRGIDRLKLDPAQSFERTLELGFDILRLAVYWDESQPSPRKYNFSAIENLLDQCDQGNQKVVLSVGMKAPRWPEYYLPEWLKIDRVEQAQTPVLTFVETAINKLKSHSAIAWWQVENEPLDSSGPRKWRIPLQLLAEEVALVRQLDNRPIHLNLWGDNVTKSAEYATAAKLADSVGLDLYYKQPAKYGLYHGPNFNWLQFKWWRWQQEQRGQFKPLWITELQAEPWEHDNAVKFSANPASINSGQLVQNFKNAQKLKPDVILFWGLEYWLWRSHQGNSDLIKAVKSILITRQSF
jgi:hypothetical protein